MCQVVRSTKCYVSKSTVFICIKKYFVEVKVNLRFIFFFVRLFVLSFCVYFMLFFPPIQILNSDYFYILFYTQNNTSITRQSMSSRVRLIIDDDDDNMLIGIRISISRYKFRRYSVVRCVFDRWRCCMFLKFFEVTIL